MAKDKRRVVWFKESFRGDRNVPCVQCNGSFTGVLHMSNLIKLFHYMVVVIAYKLCLIKFFKSLNQVGARFSKKIFSYEYMRIGGKISK